MGKQNNTVKFGVPGVFGCSGVLGLLGVFQCSCVPAFLVLIHAMKNIFEDKDSSWQGTISLALIQDNRARN